VVGIIGRNGAGKSTLLKILSRITEPTTGRAVIRGRVSSLLEVGTGFHPELTGRENVYMNGTILGMTKREIDAKFDEIVDFSGVEKFLDTAIKHYSSGMKVRLAFSVAAHLEPEILIIDEVLAVGDAEFQAKCLGKMHDVARCGRTVLFVSHNFAAVESLCSLAIELRCGSIANVGDVEEVLTQYRAQAFNSAPDADPNRFATTQILKNVSLIGDEHRPTSIIRVGSDVLLQIDIDTPHPIRIPTIGIGFDSIDGQRILTCLSPISMRLPSLESASRLHCRIPNFPLAPGFYAVKIAIADLSRELESVGDAIRFAVVDADLFGEGRGFHRGQCVARSEWTLISRKQYQRTELSSR
jgi:lipopolysaccharide transport system ATP-binding protein